LGVTQAKCTAKQRLAYLPTQAEFQAINQTTPGFQFLPGQAMLQLSTGSSQAGKYPRQLLRIPSKQANLLKIEELLEMLAVSLKL